MRQIVNLKVIQLLKSEIAKPENIDGDQYQINARHPLHVTPLGSLMKEWGVIIGTTTSGAISGTSASTPLTACIITLVNDALLAAGKKPLDFLNPWLYRTGHRGFTDITSDSAVGCGVDGFPALPGWDKVTGFGAPIFLGLVDLAMGIIRVGRAQSNFLDMEWASCEAKHTW